MPKAEGICTQSIPESDFVSIKYETLKVCKVFKHAIPQSCYFVVVQE